MTKRALCVGINYPGTDAELQGCVNDAVDWSQALRDRGYTTSILTNEMATKKAILGMLAILVAQSRFGDRIVFTYSGHGSWVPDDNGDEPDGRDEVLCAVDFREGGLIRDDELREVFSHKRFGVRVTTISDSCFSGSVTRFVDVPLAYRQFDYRKPRYLSPLAFLPEEEHERAFRASLTPLQTKPRSTTSSVLLSGCSDEEYSYDAYMDGRFNGAFTRTALNDLFALESQYGSVSLAKWHRVTRAALPSEEYPQSPQMYASVWQRRWSL